MFNEKTGKLVNLKLIDPNNDVMLIADNGIVIRVRARDISKIGRDTMGVRVMKFKGDARVVCVSESPVSEDTDGEGEGSAEEQAPATEE